MVLYVFHSLLCGFEAFSFIDGTSIAWQWRSHRSFSFGFQNGEWSDFFYGNSFIHKIGHYSLCSSEPENFLIIITWHMFWEAG